MRSCLSVPQYFQTSKIEVFECGKSSNVINNDTMSDDEVVASYVPPRYLLQNRTNSKMRVSQNFHCIFSLIFAHFSSISEFMITCMSPKVVRVMLVTVRIVKKTIFTEQTLKK